MSTSYPFTDGVSGQECVAHMDPETPGVSHPGCPFMATVTPELDCFYCAECGFNGRISGPWFMDLLGAHGWQP